MTLLKQANQALRQSRYEEAIALYVQALQSDSPVAHLIMPNLKLARQRWRLKVRESTAANTPSSVSTPSRTSRIDTPPSQSIQGAILPNGKSETIIRGWLAQLGNHEARTALLKIDDRHDYEVQCNLFRKEIHNKVNAGWHGFELVVPLHLADGKPHQLKLIDKQTQKVVAQAVNYIWLVKRTFKDFSGFLAHSLTMPMLLAPFREEDKRCFAVMENIANLLVSVAEHCEAEPKVSIIMPVYNRAKIVQASIRSALHQSYQNIELIVVDDGSTDGTGKIINGIKDQRMVVLRNDRNMGQCSCLNRAINTAQGEYIAYLDSDNTWDVRYIAAMVGAFQVLPNADALYGGQFLYRGETDKPFAMRYGSLNKSLLSNNNYIDRNAFIHKKKNTRSTRRV